MKISKEDLNFIGYIAASVTAVAGVFFGWIYLTIELEKWINAVVK